MDRKKIIHSIDDIDQADAHCEQLDAIDRLLFSVADDASASVDFDAIKLRAVNAAKSKLERRRTIKKYTGYALAACASLMIGFTVLNAYASSRSNMKNQNAAPSQYAVKEMPSAEAFKTGTVNADQTDNNQNPTKGAPAETTQTTQFEFKEEQVSIEAIMDAAEELFPENLPETMEKTVEDDGVHVYASGVDDEGEKLSYECVVTDAPIELAVGEAGSVREGEECVYYWQLSDAQCLAVRFSGFGEAEMKEMFLSLAERIASMETNSEKDE